VKYASHLTASLWRRNR